MNTTTVSIGECRLSYITVFTPKPPFNKPDGDLKYSVTVLLPKSNVQAKATLDAAINAAIAEGPAKCWNGVIPPQPAISVHDGDGPRPSDGSPFGPECKGMWVFTASCKADRPPFVVDANVQPIMQQSEIYSGVYGNVNISCFPYANTGKKGIGIGLNGIQKTRDGEPLGNTVTAQEAFTAVAQPAAYSAPAAVPGTPMYPQQAAPAYTAPAPTPVPAYQQPAPAAYPQAVPGYPAAAQTYQQPAPAIDPITGQPLPTGMPIYGM